MTITDLQRECQGYLRASHPAEYLDKYMHKVPDAPVVDRAKFIVDRCKDKTVLHIGCAGPLHKKIEEVAKEVWGIDKDDCDCENFIQTDIEAEGLMSVGVDFDLIIIGEILEHLTNPGNLLAECSLRNWDLIITVPNAFSAIGLTHIRNGFENVNKEHVAYYSYWTLKELVTRYGYVVKEFYWQNGEPLFAEGIIFIVRKQNGDI